MAGHTCVGMWWNVSDDVHALYQDEVSADMDEKKQKKKKIPHTKKRKMSSCSGLSNTL